MENQQSGFKELLNLMMKRRWLMTLVVLDTDKDKMLVQKMDEEDGVSLSNTGGAAAPTEE